MCFETLAGLALAATALGLCAARGSTSPDSVHACVVARIVDGDTFYCRDGRKVRLLGVGQSRNRAGLRGR